MPSKDAIIADLRGQVASLTRLLELALDHQPPVVSPGAIRQRRYREAHKPSQRYVTVTSLSDATPSVSSTPLPVEGDVTTVPLPNDEEERTLTVPTSPKRNGVTPLDRDRAEQDAAQRGLCGASFEAEFQRFTDYWDSAGWKRKGGVLKDRNAAWRSWLASPFRAERRATANGKAAKNAPDYSGIDAFLNHLETQGVQ